VFDGDGDGESVVEVDDEVDVADTIFVAVGD